MDVATPPSPFAYKKEVEGGSWEVFGGERGGDYGQISLRALHLHHISSSSHTPSSLLSDVLVSFVLTLDVLGHMRCSWARALLDRSCSPVRRCEPVCSPFGWSWFVAIDIFVARCARVFIFFVFVLGVRICTYLEGHLILMFVELVVDYSRHIVIKP
jgi:hypothetical protein